MLGAASQIAVFFALFGSIETATVTYDFNVTWVTSNPDGASDKSTTDINGKRPTPPITVDVGGNVVVHINQYNIYGYHFHMHGQYPDGLRGPLINNDPESPCID
ncbi:hypothetical protein DL768_011793 [Monosporascus sp. mg162]|nr:hypothetical protein DL768_011793 [Monosporascus sp. mg162]